MILDMLFYLLGACCFCVVSYRGVFKNVTCCPQPELIQSLPQPQQSTTTFYCVCNPEIFHRAFLTKSYSFPVTIYVCCVQTMSSFSSCFASFFAFSSVREGGTQTPTSPPPPPAYLNDELMSIMMAKDGEYVFRYGIDHNEATKHTVCFQRASTFPRQKISKIICPSLPQ